MSTLGSTYTRICSSILTNIQHIHITKFKIKKNPLIDKRLPPPKKRAATQYGDSLLCDHILQLAYGPETQGMCLPSQFSRPWISEGIKRLKDFALLGCTAQRQHLTQVTEDLNSRGSGLKGFAAFPEYLNSVPSTHTGVLKATCNFSSKDPTPSSSL